MTKPILINDDCRNLEQYVDQESVQCVVTSPPYYSLRDYKLKDSVWGGQGDCQHEFESNGKFKTYCKKCNAWLGNLGLEPTPDMFCEHIVEIFKKIKSVLKKDGVVFLNLGDCFYNGRPAGSCKQAENVAKDEDEWKKMKHADPKNKSRRFGVRPIDLPIDGLKPKDLIGVPWKCAFALQSDGWYLRDAVIWAKAYVDKDKSLVGSSMPNSQKDRCTHSYEIIFQLTKNKKYYFNLNEERCQSGATLRNVWHLSKGYSNEKHFASYPIELVERCIKLGSKEGDLVLDPFMGTGTTAKACLNLNRDFIGFDASDEYVEISKNRVGNQTYLNFSD